MIKYLMHASFNELSAHILELIQLKTFARLQLKISARLRLKAFAYWRLKTFAYFSSKITES